MPSSSLVELDVEVDVGVEVVFEDEPDVWVEVGIMQLRINR